MAHKKGVGSSDNGRDSHSNRLGVKLFGGQSARAGNIIIRQRGTKYHPGENVGIGKDHTIYALVPGKVYFKKKRLNRMFVGIEPFDVAETVAKAKPVKKEAAAPAPVEKAKEAPAKATKEAAAPAPVVKAKEAPAKATKKDTSASDQKDDLKKIEGIGPKIAELLNNAGIFTFTQLAETDASKVREILAEAGNRYKAHDPTTWPDQSKMAAAGEWDKLKAWQDELDGGKIVKPSSDEE